MTRQVVVPYKYVHTFLDRRGRQRIYFRKGTKRVALPGRLGSPKFLRAYHAALAGTPLPPEKVARAHKIIDRAANGSQPRIGVYILMLEGEVEYVGSSLDMPVRVAGHRQNGRLFDRAFYIATKIDERIAVEGALIRALQPRSNRARAKREPRLANPHPAVANPA